MIGAPRMVHRPRSSTRCLRHAVAPRYLYLIVELVQCSALLVVNRYRTSKSIYNENKGLAVKRIPLTYPSTHMTHNTHDTTHMTQHPEQTWFTFQMSRDAFPSRELSFSGSSRCSSQPHSTRRVGCGKLHSTHAWSSEWVSTGWRGHTRTTEEQGPWAHHFGSRFRASR